MPDLAFLDSRGLNPPFARPFELCENDTLSSRFTKISDILNTLHEAFFNHVLKIVLFFFKCFFMSFTFFLGQERMDRTSTRRPDELIVPGFQRSASQNLPHHHGNSSLFSFLNLCWIYLKKLEHLGWIIITGYYHWSFLVCPEWLMKSFHLYFFCHFLSSYLSLWDQNQFIGLLTLFLSS